jgi:hypothetical protein
VTEERFIFRAIGQLLAISFLHCHGPFSRSWISNYTWLAGQSSKTLL